MTKSDIISEVSSKTGLTKVETEAVFDFTPTRDEIEGLLIYLNKDKLAQA